MKTNTPENYCEKCRHELIHGVACDWRDAKECPMVKDNKKTKAKNKHFFYPERIAAEDELFVILSNN